MLVTTPGPTARRLSSREDCAISARMSLERKRVVPSIRTRGRRPPVAQRWTVRRPTPRIEGDLAIGEQPVGPILALSRHQPKIEPRESAWSTNTCSPSSVRNKSVKGGVLHVPVHDLTDLPRHGVRNTAVAQQLEHLAGDRDEVRLGTEAMQVGSTCPRCEKRQVPPAPNVSGCGAFGARSPRARPHPSPWAGSPVSIEPRIRLTAGIPGLRFRVFGRYGGFMYAIAWLKALAKPKPRVSSRDSLGPAFRLMHRGHDRPAAAARANQGRQKH